MMIFRSICWRVTKTVKMSTAVEIQLPVPWGHIAGKAWGDPSGKHVLALHGWLDNAGSFDRLIPLLSSDLHIVAVDFPGHGQSSHRPRGSHYNSFNYVADIQYIIDALKWDSFSFLSHSMGAGAASWYSGSQPQLVERLVLLDGGGFITRPVTEIPKSMGHALKDLSASDKLVDNNIFQTWDAVVDRVLDGHRRFESGFTREAAAVLAIRGSRQLTESGEYCMSRDLRLKQPSLLRIPEDMNVAFLSAIQCPTLLIRPTESYVNLDMTLEMSFKSSIKALDRGKFRQLTVSGGHHVHLEHPERVNTAINDFLIGKL